MKEQFGFTARLVASEPRFGYLSCPTIPMAKAQRAFVHFMKCSRFARFLKSLGVNAELIRDVQRQLAAGRSASVPNVALSEDVVKSSGLNATAKVGAGR